MDFTTLADDALATLRSEKVTAFTALTQLSAATAEQEAEAIELAADIDAIDAESRSRKFTAVRGRTFAQAEPEPEPEPAPAEPTEPEPVVEPGTTTDPEPQPEPAAEPEADPEPVVEPAPTQTEAPAVTASATRTGRRPVLPGSGADLVTITAAADTGFALGQVLDLGDVGQGVINRLSNLQPPQGNGETEDLRKFPVAKFAIDFPEDLVLDRNSDPNEVMRHVGDESRLDEDLVAAGWCAPSEVIYDLCGGEVVDGLVDIPEMQVKRGGFRHTRGFDFSTIYAAVGFNQTEAQAIANTVKPCYEVPCPTFTDVRLEVQGLCIKVPILTEVGYPEVVKDVMAKAMVAHQYKINALTLSKMVAFAGAARVYTGLGAVTTDTLEAITLVLQQTRQKYRLGKSATMEVVLPVHMLEVFRNDIGRRNGVGAEAITDAQINAHFTVRKMRIQWVYGWQELAVSAATVAYPATFQFLAYPAGTFVKGVSDVISLSAVYDAASLATNTYTGLFMEEGLLVEQMCYEAVLGTVPICAAGITGAQTLDCLP